MAFAIFVIFINFDLQYQFFTKAGAVSKPSRRQFGDRPKPKPGHYPYRLSRER
jgi:hypothetical protein